MPTDRRPALLLFALLCGAAQAETSPWYVGASQAWLHSSNLLRLSEGQAAPEGQSQADTVSSSSLLGGIDQPFGRQRLFGTLVLRSNRYSHNDLYDNESYAVNGGLDWATAERISGSVKGSANRNLASFTTDQGTRLSKKNLETTKQIDATVRVGVVTALSLEATAGKRSINYSAVEFQSRAFSELSSSFGLRWRADGSSQFGLAVRDTRGHYPWFRPDVNGDAGDRYERRDLDLSANLQPSGASRVDARLSFGHTEYEQASYRDLSGVTGLLRWSWQAGGRLKLDTRLSRDPGQSSYFLENFFDPQATVDYSRVTTALRLRADYEASAKIGLNASLTRAKRSLARLESSVFGSDELTGSDSTTTIAFGAVWTPTRSLQFGCDLAREKRRSGSALSSAYSDTSVSCSGQIVLQ